MFENTPHNPHVSLHASGKPLVFVVDDDDIFLKILKRHLEMKKEFTVQGFSTGEECIANLHLRPAVVVLDYNLNRSGGELNGEQTLAIIQQKSNRPKVIMLSGQDDGQLVLNLIRQGIRDYVVKGANALNELDEILSDYLAQGR